MQRWLGGLAAVALVVAGCSATSDDPPAPAPSSSSATTGAPVVSLASEGIDWPRSGSPLRPSDPPAAPDGFDDALVSRMADVLTAWAGATTVDADVWHSDAPAEVVAGALPSATGTALTQQTSGAISPGLAVANVFGDAVEVVGQPAVTTAWKVATTADDSGQAYVVLQLQTRAAYEVRSSGGPTRVVGVLRVHGLSAYPGTTDDFGVTTGWQEFGAGDCALALDDRLVPDDDLDAAGDDLATFVDVGDQPALRMPALDDDQRVDDAYLDRCRNGTT